MQPTMGKRGRKHSREGPLEEMSGAWLPEGEGEFANMSWDAFVARCNAYMEKGKLKCVCCDKTFKGTALDPSALYSHVGAKVGSEHHPSAITWTRWEREWQQEDCASSPNDAVPILPPPLAPEAEEERLAAPDLFSKSRCSESEDAQPRPRASRKQRKRDRQNDITGPGAATMEEPGRKSLEDLLGKTVGETLPTAEGEFANVSWAAFVARCNAYSREKGMLKCVCCNKTFKCAAIDPYALYTHVKAKVGSEHHPSARTWWRWEREWEQGERSSSSTDAFPTRPPPWALEAEEDRLAAEDEAQDTQHRPLASRRQNKRRYVHDLD